jgi:2'-phosphotransferase
MSRESIYAKPREKKRGLPKDSPEVRNSKTLAWLLRHGAQSEGISIRPDGYVEVRDLVSLLRLFETWR